MKIAVTSPTFSTTPELVAALAAGFPDLQLNLQGKRLQGMELAGFAQGAEGLIVGLEPVDTRLLQQLGGLKAIAKFGVGLDNIDLDACRLAGIYVGWTGGVNRRSVAELTLGLMLNLCRRISASSLQLREGVWRKDGGRQLSNMTVGIIGLGSIGRDLACLLKPFGCRILANDLIDIGGFCAEHGLQQADKATIFVEADIVTIHTPLTDLTRGMVNLAVLRSMRADAFLINTARGEIVVESDLKQALAEGLIAGAALDVYETEPVSDPELPGIPNLVCTPHIGGSSREAVLAMGMSAIEHLKEFFRV